MKKIFIPEYPARNEQADAALRKMVDRERALFYEWLEIEVKAGNTEILSRPSLEQHLLFMEARAKANGVILNSDKIETT